MSRVHVVAALFFCLAMAPLNSVDAADSAGNPIRKVVTLMQNMQKEIEAEGQKEKDLFDKFMCFCGSSSGDLQKSADDAERRAEELAAKLSSSKAEKTQLEQDIAQHKQDRSDAKSDVAKATALREKELAEYSDMSADSQTNIAAMGNAVAALEGGMGGASLMQMPHIHRVHQLVENSPNLDALDRRNVIAFLDQTGDYVPQGGQIVGILKQMKDEMDGDLNQATTEEKQAASSFKQLKASKDTETKLASQSIETKMSRSGTLAIEVVQTKDELEDEQEEAADAKKFLGNLGEQCATKQKEWDGRVKARNDEIAAVGEAIKILSDDDALEVFKKTLPSASLLQTGLRFLQRSVVRASPLTKARALIAQVASEQQGPEFKLMLFTMNSKLKLRLGNETAGDAADADADAAPKQTKGGALDVVAKIVDGMIRTLDKQQVSDDKQNDWCKGELMEVEDQDKAAKEKVADLEATVAELEDGAQQLVEQLKPINQEIQDLDRSVAEATEQRKEEHAEYSENLQMNSVAEKLVGKARNRLHQFYKPSQFKEPATPASMLQEEQRMSAGTFLQVAASSTQQQQSQNQFAVAPPEAPATFSGGVKKNEGSDGVLGMMDTIIQDLVMTSREAEMDENTAQRDYGKLMAESQETRAQLAKSVTNKEAAKAVLESKVIGVRQTHSDANVDVSNIKQLLNDIHVSCDFLMENYEARKQKRVTEVDSLKESKTLVAGAKQTHAEGEAGEAAAVDPAVAGEAAAEAEAAAE